MSHYTVAVITREKPNESLIDDLLAPFDEEREVVHYISKEEIVAKAKKYFEKYKNGNYAEYIKDPKGYIEKHKKNPDHIKYISEEFPKQFDWTDEDFYKDEIKYENPEDIMPDGSIKSTYNPDSKWDWYCIGGRWDGLLTTTSSESENTAQIKDIINRYDKKDAKKAGYFWDCYVDKTIFKTEDELRKEFGFILYNPEYYKKYYQSKENYMRCTATLSTYAVLFDTGEWLEKGKMGWFGCSDQEETAEIDWAEFFDKDIWNSGKYDGYWMTIVDCHI